MPWPRRTTGRPSASASSGTKPEPEPVRPDLLEWANALDATSLSAQTVKDGERFLRDYRKISIPARREIGFRLRSKVEAQVRPRPPVALGNMDVIATALAARRRQLGLGDELKPQ
jgi:hypothetical protein